VTAVAVESALLESSPTQCPSGFNSRNNASVARFRADCSRSVAIDPMGD
jgi:hypothetical protein